MYKQHPVFEAPEPQTKLWRYVDFTKYVWLLNAKAMFFSRADLLGDPFEGSYSRANLDLRPQMYANLISPEQLAGLTSFRQQLVRKTFVNCWYNVRLRVGRDVEVVPS
jgi:hypothetical protein